MDFDRWPRARWWRTITALSLVLLVVDFVTGPYIMFPISFVLPVMLAGWYLGLWPSLTFATALVTARFATMIFHWDAPHGVFVALLNALIRIIVLGTMSYLVDLAARQQGALEARLKSLEGLLPLCLTCGKIRTDTGKWETVEEFVTSRSETRFSKGMCETCGRQHQPHAFTTEE